MKPLILLTVIALLTGCAASWQPVKETLFKSKSGTYSMTIPAGWMMLESSGNAVQLSRDGSSIQNLSVDLATSDVFFSGLLKAQPNDKPKIDGTTPSSELADYFVAELNTMKLAGLTILDKQPVKLAGARGVRVRYSYKNERGNLFQAEQQFAYTKHGIIGVHYQAASSFHWERDYASYADALRTLKLGA